MKSFHSDLQTNIQVKSMESYKTLQTTFYPQVQAVPVMRALHNHRRLASDHQCACRNLSIGVSCDLVSNVSSTMEREQTDELDLIEHVQCS